MDPVDHDLEPGTEVATETPDYEARARSMGWKPREEYRGPPGAWRDAKTFVEKGENELPVLRERMRKQDQDLTAIRQKLDESREVIADMAERTRKADERAYARARAELDAERRRAVEAGDTRTYDELERRREALEAEKPKPVPQPRRDAVDPEVTQWVAENAWFSDPALAAAADGIHRALLQSNPGMSVRQNLDTVTARMKAAFPERFPAERRAAAEPDEVDENPRRRGPADVTASSAPTVPSRAPAKSFRSLPQESKDAYERYARSMRDSKPNWKQLTQEEWAATYYEKEG